MEKANKARKRLSSANNGRGNAISHSSTNLSKNRSLNEALTTDS
jgi:hypothetical protein